MTGFPKIKRAEIIPDKVEWNEGIKIDAHFTVPSILTERKSRAVWARALAFAVHEWIVSNGDLISDARLNEIQEALLAEAEKDEGTK